MEHLGLSRFTGESRCLWQRWVPAFAGKARSGRKQARPLFLSMLALTGLMLLTPAAAEVREGTYRIGVLTTFAQEPVPVPLVEELVRLGYVEGRNTTFEVRSGLGPEKLHLLANELVALGPDVIYAQTTPALIAIKKVDTSIPVVFTGVGGDPVGLGLVDSIPRPGKNLTGVVNNVNELNPKRLQLVRELIHDIHRVAVFQNPLNPSSLAGVEVTKNAADVLGIQVIPIEINGAEDLREGIGRAAQLGAQALISSADSVVFGQRKAIIELVRQRKLPAIYNFRVEVIEGGLLSYGVDNRDQLRRVAVYLDKILRGAKPADLPVEQASKISLVINLNTARELGIDIPAVLLARADEVVE
jgi:putative ABC transport system substrate-binding protein